MKHLGVCVRVIGLGLGLLSLGACGDGEGGGGTPDDPATVCNERNEDCAPGLCGGEGPRMLPGSSCVSCHREGSGAGEAGSEANQWFTAAGTLFEGNLGQRPVAGAIVRITDAEGTTVEMTSNDVGNFFTKQPLVFPIRAEVERDGRTIGMMQAVSTGDCTSCHRCGGMAGGKLYAP